MVVRTELIKGGLKGQLRLMAFSPFQGHCPPYKKNKLIFFSYAPFALTRFKAH